MSAGKDYEHFFNVWFGDGWECRECGCEEWVINASADGHSCAGCGHAESLALIPALAAAQDKRGKVDFAAVMSVYDDGVKHQHHRSARWRIQLALIDAGVMYGRVMYRRDEIFMRDMPARQYIQLMLHPKGMRCPECNKYKGRECVYEGRYQCCGKKFSVYKHTPMANTRVGAHLWLRALWALKNGTAPQDTDWLSYVMQTEWARDGSLITPKFDPYYGQTVRSMVDRLNADEQFCDMVGAEFDYTRRPNWVKRYLRVKQGDPYDAVQYP